LSEELVNIEILENAGSVAERAAAIIAERARAAVVARSRFVMAVSGGHTPWLMLQRLAADHVPWRAVHVAQVDERVAPAGHPDRNLTQLRESLLDHSLMLPCHVHEMPVESPDLEIAAAQYAVTLAEIAGSPPSLDLVHLGLGPDGHTASLVPGDPVLDIENADIALTRPYQGRRRMTLTYSIINRSRSVLWVVTGSEKATALSRLLSGDHSIPAGRIRAEQALVIADQAAAEQLMAEPRKKA
jgi:6-phosphogluconolactonase